VVERRGLSLPRSFDGVYGVGICPRKRLTQLRDLASEARPPHPIRGQIVILDLLSSRLRWRLRMSKRATASAGEIKAEQAAVWHSRIRCPGGRDHRPPVRVSTISSVQKFPLSFGTAVSVYRIILFTRRAGVPTQITYSLTNSMRNTDTKIRTGAHSIWPNGMPARLGPQFQDDLINQNRLRA